MAATPMLKACATFLLVKIDEGHSPAEAVRLALDEYPGESREALLRGATYAHDHRQRRLEQERRQQEAAVEVLGNDLKLCRALLERLPGIIHRLEAEERRCAVHD